MKLAYITADCIGNQTGGGVVTKNELQALRELGDVVACFSQENLSCKEQPWGWDDDACTKVPGGIDLAHFYSGSFPKTVKLLKDRGTKVVYTIAAHDKEISKKEHTELGLSFPYPHLTEEPLWQQYIEGYKLADCIICPSTVAAETVRSYGPAFRSGKRIEVVPHGVDLPKCEPQPLPRIFTCGYLGSFGADKGVRYLLEAWKKLNYKDSILLLAGSDSQGPWARMLWNQFGGGNVRFLGWLEDVADFYNHISLYVQPSTTEGFGIEVLESMAYSRPVVCSKAAGAADIVDPSGVTDCSAEAIAEKIDFAHWVHHSQLYPIKDGKFLVDPAFPTGLMDLTAIGKFNRGLAENYTWGKIKQQYINVWKSVLNV